MNTAKAIVYKLYMGETRNPLLINFISKNESGFKESLLHSGKSVRRNWPKKFTVTVDGTQPIDYFMCGGRYGVVSQRAMDVVQSFTEDTVEFLPVQVISQNLGGPIGQYWILNILTNIDALDWKRTMWGSAEVPYDNEWASFLKPAFKLKMVENQHMFVLRIGKTIRSGIFVSDALRKSLKINNADLGMGFVPLKVT